MATEAEKWAFERILELFTDRMNTDLGAHREDLLALAYNAFDQNLDNRTPVDGRLLLSAKYDAASGQAFYVERGGCGFFLVAEWAGEKVAKVQLEGPAAEEASRWLGHPQAGKSAVIDQLALDCWGSLLESNIQAGSDALDKQRAALLLEMKVESELYKHEFYIGATEEERTKMNTEVVDRALWFMNPE